MLILVLWGATGINIGNLMLEMKERREIRAQWREEQALEEVRLREEREKREAERREKRGTAYREKLDEKAERMRRRAIDIPMDEADSVTDDPSQTEERPKKKAGRTSLFNSKPNTKSPDELFSEREEEPAAKPESQKPAEPVISEPKEPEVVDFGIDVPFFPKKQQNKPETKIENQPGKLPEKPAEEIKPAAAEVKKPAVKQPEPIAKEKPADEEPSFLERSQTRSSRSP